MSKLSASVVERNKGNEFFKHAKVPGISYIVKKGRLEDAFKCYNRAENLARNEDDYTSAVKNRGKTTLRLVKLLKENFSTAESSQSTVDEQNFYLKEAIKLLCLGYEKGQHCKQDEWRHDIVQSLNECTEELFDQCDEMDNRNEQIKLLFAYAEIFTVKYLAVDVYSRLANVLFRDGAKKLEDYDYKGALSRFKDCYQPIEEVKRINSLYPDILVLETDVFYHTCSAESVQARENGNRLLGIAVQDEETLSVDLIWDVIDWYKRAAILTKELDLEEEAHALSQLGYVYKKVLKLKYRSKDYYKRCFQLAESMKPRTFFTKEWYKQSVSALQEFQMEERKRDDREIEKERQKILKELKEEMGNLKKNNTGSTEFLTFLYKTYPPKDADWKKPSDEEMAKWPYEKKPEKKLLHKLLLKGIQAYHPDKVDVEEHGKKWKVFTEEIVKMLNAYFEETKFSSNVSSFFEKL